MIIDPVRLPEHLEQGARIGPTFSTSLVSVVSGADEANQNWQDELLEIDAGYGIMSDYNPNDPEDSYLAIVAFFRARRGRARGFLFRDATDFVATLENVYELPTEPGSFQLCKTYDSYVRRLTRPDVETLLLFRNNIAIPKANYEYAGKGKIKFKNGQATDNVTASFEFDIPVRFVSDKMLAQITHIRAGQIPDITLAQVRE